MTTTTKETRGSHTPRSKRQLNVYINEESSAILKALLERDGVPYSAQVDRALRLWAAEKGIEVPHANLKKGVA
jgi:hypothetical protein